MVVQGISGTQRITIDDEEQSPSTFFFNDDDVPALCASIEIRAFNAFKK